MKSVVHAKTSRDHHGVARRDALSRPPPSVRADRTIRTTDEAAAAADVFFAIGRVCTIHYGPSSAVLTLCPGLWVQRLGRRIPPYRVCGGTRGAPLPAPSFPSSFAVTSSRSLLIPNII